jgi:hypothetical protein
VKTWEKVQQSVLIHYFTINGSFCGIKGYVRPDFMSYDTVNCQRCKELMFGVREGRRFP